jgi:hypothetical protein
LDELLQSNSWLQKRVEQLTTSLSALSSEVKLLKSLFGFEDAVLQTNNASGVLVEQHSAASDASSTDPSGSVVASAQLDRSTFADVARRAPVAPFASRAAVPPPPTLDAQLRRDLVSAVYVDMQSTQRRARNIIITGFPTATRGSEAEHVEDFLDVEFQRRFDIVNCRRVGKPYPGKLQPLLVTLANERQAAYLVDNAKRLRASSTSYVSQSIYINADMTRAQAKAAYDIRCRRREINRRSATSGRVFTRTRPDQQADRSFAVEEPMSAQSTADAGSASSPPGLRLSGLTSAASAHASNTISNGGSSADAAASTPVNTAGTAQLAGSCA